MAPTSARSGAIVRDAFLSKVTGMPGNARVMFLYWGRRGSMSQLVLELARVAGPNTVFSVASNNELFESIRATGVPLVPVRTYDHSIGAILHLPRVLAIRRQLTAAIREHRIDKVIVLMPHVWTPLTGRAIGAAGARYAIVLHDAVAHPGDRTGLANRWLLRSANDADEVVALSRHVARQLKLRNPKLADRMRVLFHPNLFERAMPASVGDGRKLGFLFLGRIMAYKGLPLFVEACEILRARGLDFNIGVAGEGSLGVLKARLEALGAEIVNRWFRHEEVNDLVSRYDVVVLPHLEASQSGVIALAHSLGLPVIATAVGGIVEQIEDGRTGMLVGEATATAFAASMERYLTDADLRRRLHQGVTAALSDRSIARFYEAVTE
jgi:glycosyltransferase involved in cell wall biosynthesis